MTLILETRGFEETIELLEEIGILEQLEEAVEILCSRLVQFVRPITPVDTGAMQAAWESEARGLVGTVFTNPSALNPRSGVRVTSYASKVAARVGIPNALMIEAVRMAAPVTEKITWIR